MNIDYEIPESVCPCCGYRMTDATKIHGEEKMANPGDCSVCLNCGQILIFDADLILRKATAAQIRALMNDAGAWDIINRAVIAIEKRGRLHDEVRS